MFFCYQRPKMKRESKSDHLKTHFVFDCFVGDPDDPI